MTDMCKCKIFMAKNKNQVYFKNKKNHRKNTKNI